MTSLATGRFVTCSESRTWAEYGSRTNPRNLIVLISNNTDSTYRNDWQDGTLHFAAWSRPATTSPSRRPRFRAPRTARAVSSGRRWSTSTTRPCPHRGEYGDPGDTLTFRVPAGRYSVMASFMSWCGRRRTGGPGAATRTSAIAGDTSMRVDLSQAKRLTASVDGVATEAGSVGLTYIQTARRGAGWTDFAFAWGDAAKAGTCSWSRTAGPASGRSGRTPAFGLDAPGSGPSPYLYDLIHPYGNGIPGDPAYRVTAAEQATLARIDQHFNRLDMPDSGTGHKRYGFSPEGAYPRREQHRSRSPATAPTTCRPASPGWTRRSGTGRSPRRRMRPVRAGQPAGQGRGYGSRCAPTGSTTRPAPRAAARPPHRPVPAATCTSNWSR